VAETKLATVITAPLAEAAVGAGVFLRVIILRWHKTRVQGSGFRVQGSGFRVQGSGFRVQGFNLDI